MKMMTNGTIKRYVPDSNVETYKAMGYVVEDEPAKQDVPAGDSVPPTGSEENPAFEKSSAGEPAEETDEGEPEAENDAEDDKPVCPICGKKYASQATLDRHIREKHSQE